MVDGQEQTLPFRDTRLPLQERVRDLIGRMTLAEKVYQMTSEAEAIPRLGIPAYNYWSEALHGVARNGRATVFPQAIGLSATWDPGLIERTASAIADEGRAKYHAALRRKGFTSMYQGLTFWSPNVNIFRDPRWGRGQETWGEDPYLAGEMGAAFVRGLQGEHPHYLKAAACAKHYAVHSGPEKLRHSFDALVSDRELYDTYLPAFKKLVEAGVEAVMGAYNRTNGEACCASPVLLERILRQEWGFAGHVVSDCGALDDIHKHHHLTRDAVESAALALKAGCDLSCVCTYEHLGEAVERGLIDEADLDRALERTLKTRFKLGMFDPPEQVPYASIPMEVVGCDAHRQLAYETAVKSVVLLKNFGGILPVSEEVRSILVTGPTATDVMVLLGNYYGLSNSMTTLLEGLVGRTPEGVKIEYRPGVMLVQQKEASNDWSVVEGSTSDLTIACVGLSPLMEGEEGDALLSAESGDKKDLALPRLQVNFIKKLAMAGAKIVLVVTGGSPVELDEVVDLVQAIVWAWYPGQEGGRAVADVLFGDHSPSGRLTVTFPQSLGQLPPFDDYSLDGRTYRYAKWEPLFPFGFGLSYTRFEYRNLSFSKTTLAEGESLDASFTLENGGAVEGEEVVQVYLSDLQASAPVPQHKLVSFRRERLGPGESRQVTVTVTPEMMMLVDEDGRSKLEPGEFRLEIGGCSPGERGQALGAPQPVIGTFTVQAA